MSGRQRMTGLALLLISAMAVSAQEPRPNTNPAAPQPGIVVPHVPSPPTVRPGIITPIPSGNVPQRVLTLIPSPPGAGTFARTEQLAERHSVPAKLELSDGTKLAGDLYSEGPLRGVALFGPVAIPLNQIRGIDWQAKSDQDEQGDEDRKAKVVLINADSLTMTLTMPTIHLKTSWGHAAVDLAKVQSLVLTAEKYKWEDTPLGRQLVPDGEPNTGNPPP